MSTQTCIPAESSRPAQPALTGEGRFSALLLALNAPQMRLDTSLTRRVLRSGPVRAASAWLTGFCLFIVLSLF
jgi:hypothetical protein